MKVTIKQSEQKTLTLGELPTGTAFMFAYTNADHIYSVPKVPGGLMITSKNCNYMLCGTHIAIFNHNEQELIIAHTEEKVIPLIIESM